MSAIKLLMVDVYWYGMSDQRHAGQVAGLQEAVTITFYKSNINNFTQWYCLLKNTITLQSMITPKVFSSESLEQWQQMCTYFVGSWCYTYNGRAFTSWTHCKNTPSALHLPPWELLDTSWHTTARLLSMDYKCAMVSIRLSLASQKLWDCKYNIGSFPGLPTVQFLILYSKEGESPSVCILITCATSRLERRINCTWRTAHVAQSSWSWQKYTQWHVNSLLRNLW